MRRLAAIVVVVLVYGCGRIGFDATRRDEREEGPALVDGAVAADDARTDDAAAAACGWQPCAAGAEACCVGDVGMCVATGTCAGAVYSCSSIGGGRCPITSRCCEIPGRGSQCLNVNTVCDPDEPIN